MDPSEIHAVKVEEAQRLCQSLHEAIAAIEAMRDHAAEAYRVENGKPWSATSGSRTSRTLTASQIDARDYLAARAAEDGIELALNNAVAEAVADIFVRQR
ncbi:MAG: hypothetical protein CVT83_05910, partial [Alphaproteobacteria bacterium HGW-Alphaproteobacteria-5]